MTVLPYIKSMKDLEISTLGFEKQILRCIHMAFMCVQEVVKDRPFMTSVVLMLNGEKSNHPKEVAFVHKQNPSTLKFS
ncbi:unnamed protein product [Lupinus luteus]|uniref:S-locus receptor kinase C-terminal domain-containing protein n=1 Tax=Lupinus luteus TaxID=3873 RepID=A0AAV1XE92_LUPLU